MNPVPVAAFSLTGLFESAQITWPTVLYLLGGVGMTGLLIVCAMGLGLVLGTALASLQVYGPRWCRWLAGLYVWFFRGVPILVLLFLFHFGLVTMVEELIRQWLGGFPRVVDLVGAWFGWPLRVPAFVSAALVLGLCSTAYQSQIFRGAMQSIPTGQFRAARALGMSAGGAVRTIILPQALRISIPAWSNEYSILLKDSAIAFVLGVSETMARFKAVASTTHQYLLMYILAGLVYFVVTWIGVRLLLALYEKVRIPGLAEVDGTN